MKYKKEQNLKNGGSTKPATSKGAPPGNVNEKKPENMSTVSSPENWTPSMSGYQETLIANQSVPSIPYIYPNNPEITNQTLAEDPNSFNCVPYGSQSYVNPAMTANKMQVYGPPEKNFLMDQQRLQAYQGSEQSVNQYQQQAPCNYYQQWNEQIQPQCPYQVDNYAYNCFGQESNACAVAAANQAYHLNSTDNCQESSSNVPFFTDLSVWMNDNLCEYQSNLINKSYDETVRGNLSLDFAEIPKDLMSL